MNRQPSEPQVVSRCCRAALLRRGSVTHYYECGKCGRPADPVPNPKAAWK